jgi:hypothetical protein
MDVAPFIKDGRTVVPLRFISTGLAKLIGKPVAIMPIYGDDGKTAGVDIILLEE